MSIWISRRREKGGWGRKNATAGKEKERRRMFFEGLYEEILGDVYAWIRS